MFGVTVSDDYQPVAWVGRYPVHVATLLVAVHSMIMVITCFLMAFGSAAFLNLLVFDSAQVLGMGHVWQIVTYAFVHAPYSGSALLWFAVEMYMLFVFGREVERFIGRNAFIILYALLLCVPTIFLTVGGILTRLGLAGSGALHFGVFIAFATIYPSAVMFLRIQAKWVALVLAAIGTLGALAGRDWSSITVLWVSIATGFLFIRFRGIGPELVWWDNLKSTLRPKPKFHVVPKASSRRVIDPADDLDSIDPVLEKISRSGIGSLTASERRALDRARARLLKKSE